MGLLFLGQTILLMLSTMYLFIIIYAIIYKVILMIYHAVHSLSLFAYLSRFL